MALVGPFIAIVMILAVAALLRRAQRTRPSPFSAGPPGRPSGAGPSRPGTGAGSGSGTGSGAGSGAGQPGVAGKPGPSKPGPSKPSPGTPGPGKAGAGGKPVTGKGGGGPAEGKPGAVQPTKLTDYLADDYGLLATAAVARTQADALLVKEHLRSAGIRSTLATAPDGQIRVLVFGDEVVRARRLVGQ
jgi:hypothetical protein